MNLKRSTRLGLIPFAIALLSGSFLYTRARGDAGLFVKLPPSYGPAQTTFSPDSRRALLMVDDSIRIVDVKSGAKLCDLQLPKVGEGVNNFSWAPDGSRVVAGYLGDPNHQILMWDSRSGRLDHQWVYPQNLPNSSWVTFTNDGRKLLGETMPPTLFDAKTGRVLSRFHSSFKPFAGCAILSPNEKLVALGSADLNKIEVRDLKTDQVIWKVQGLVSGEPSWSQQNVLCLRLYKNAVTNPLVLWDGTRRKMLLAPPQKDLYPFSLNNAAPLVAAEEHTHIGVPAGQDPVPSTLMVWNYRSGKTAWTHRSSGLKVDLKWSPNGKWLMVLDEIADANQMSIFDTAGL